MSSDGNSLSEDRHWHPTGRHNSPHNTDRQILCLSTNCHSDRDIYRSNRHVLWYSRGKYINAQCMHLSAYLNLTSLSLLDDFRSASSVIRELQVRGQCSAVNMQETESRPPAGASCFVTEAAVGCGKTIKRNLILIRNAEKRLLPVFLHTGLHRRCDSRTRRWNNNMFSCDCIARNESLFCPFLHFILHSCV